MPEQVLGGCEGMPRALRTEGFLGEVFWSGGVGFGTVDVHSYLLGVSRDKPLSEEPLFCLGASRWLSPNRGQEQTS